ncbi:hypothetical protein HIM_05626 [Hirsutella minnesotensis 3608]|uniref:Nucleoside phosphorylase domain-containing protein n=1 Tax=Hirsutella minnesotensis 3608 TaxID=1043627 RepID=A0A0F7ZPA1_9HYPO|nr:hypothetical protein HIM_05626 [Hirsutella minnesotensis 3608]
MPSNCSTASAQRPSHREEFEVAIICALSLEYDAVIHLFDEFWDEHDDHYGKSPGDLNIYTTGRVGRHNVVLALLPQMGKAHAAGAAASMRSSYCNVKIALLVGVCGAVPRSQNVEILLGDVIISKTVVQYDFGRRYPDRFIGKNTALDSLSRPNKRVRNLLAVLETDRGRDRLEAHAAYFLQQLQAKAADSGRPARYGYPGMAKDELFESSYRHKHNGSPSCVCRGCFVDSDPVCDEALTSSCAELGCDDGHLVTRERLQATATVKPHSLSLVRPAIHLGAVASGDGVMKSATHRDKISREASVIAFEMEGAGVWDEMPSIVIKGVCDYADTHKHKGWQDFSAATAASVSKAILELYI